MTKPKLPMRFRRGAPIIPAIFTIGNLFLGSDGWMWTSGSSFKVPVISLAFPLLIVLLPTLFASFYASYRDVFGVEKE